MSKIPIQSEIRLELQDILEGIGQLDTESLEIFAEKVNQLVAQRKSPALAKEETILLKQINEGISPDVLERFQALQIQQKNSGLNEAQQAELKALVDLIENMETNRLAHLIQLANLREISVEDLRIQLGIQPAQPHVW